MFIFFLVNQHTAENNNQTVAIIASNISTKELRPGIYIRGEVKIMVPPKSPSSNPPSFLRYLYTKITTTIISTTERI